MFLYEGRGVRAALEGKRKGDPIFPFNNEIFINVLKKPPQRSPSSGRTSLNFPSGQDEGGGQGDGGDVLGDTEGDARQWRGQCWR